MLILYFEIGDSFYSAIMSWSGHEMDPWTSLVSLSHLVLKIFNTSTVTLSIQNIVLYC